MRAASVAGPKYSVGSSLSMYHRSISLCWMRATCAAVLPNSSCAYAAFSVCVTSGAEGVTSGVSCAAGRTPPGVPSGRGVGEGADGVATGASISSAMLPGAPKLLNAKGMTKNATANMPSAVKIGMRRLSKTPLTRLRLSRFSFHLVSISCII